MLDLPKQVTGLMSQVQEWCPPWKPGGESAAGLSLQMAVHSPCSLRSVGKALPCSSLPQFTFAIEVNPPPATCFSL